LILDDLDLMLGDFEVLDGVRLTDFLGVVARDLEMERERPRFGAGDLPLRDGVLDFLRGVV
jgi:hypothetical protein